MGQRQRVQAVIIQNNKILFGEGLIGKQNFGHFFIGGRIEAEESAEEAMHRELREEANVDGKIIFKFQKEYKENHHTFFIDIGNQTVSLGYDPEDEQIEKEPHLRTLQKLEFIAFDEVSRFSLIDIEYFKLLLEECNIRNYFPEWHEKMKKLVESYSL